MQVQSHCHDAHGPMGLHDKTVVGKPEERRVSFSWTVGN